MNEEPSGRRRGRGRGRGRGLGSGVARSMPSKLRWSIKEQKLLLDGLKRYSHEDLNSLCRMVPTKSKAEIQDFLKILKGSNLAKIKREQPITKAPIENWLDLCSELVYYEQEDFSKLLSQVFSIISHFSDLPESTAPHLEPNYRKLYRYIAAVIADKPQLPTLTSLESAVILDLIHSVGDVLRVSDTTLQRKVMCWKYKMLNHKYACGSLEDNLARIRKALVNDFSDLQKAKCMEGQQESIISRSCNLDSDTAAFQTSASQPGVSHSLETCQNGEASIGSLAEDDASQMLGDVFANNVFEGESRCQEKEKTSNKKRRGRKRIHQWRIPLKKPPLFTINPFCIPVRLLPLKRHVDDLDPNADALSPHLQRLQGKPPALTSKTGSLMVDCAVQAAGGPLKPANDFELFHGYLPSKSAQEENHTIVPLSSAVTAASCAAGEPYSHRVASTIQVDQQKTGTALMNAQGTIQKGIQYRLLKMQDGRRALVPVHLVNPAGPMMSPLCAPVLGRAVSVGTSDAKVGRTSGVITSNSSKQPAQHSHEHSTKSASAKESAPSVVVHRVFKAERGSPVPSRFSSSLKTYSSRKPGCMPSEHSKTRGYGINAGLSKDSSSAGSIATAVSSGRQDAGSNVTGMASALMVPSVAVASPVSIKSVDMQKEMSTMNTQPVLTADRAARSANNRVDVSLLHEKPSTVTNIQATTLGSDKTQQGRVYQVLQSNVHLKNSKDASQGLRKVVASNGKARRPNLHIFQKSGKKRTLDVDFNSANVEIVTPDEARERILRLESKASNRNVENTGQQITTFMEDKHGNVYHTVSI